MLVQTKLKHAEAEVVPSSSSVQFKIESDLVVKIEVEAGFKSFSLV